jgi:hypothetical protein
MKKRLRKIVLWGSGLLVYGLLLIAVVSQILDPDKVQLAPPIIESPVTVFRGQESVQSLLNVVTPADGFSGILLPLGPDGGRLPGIPALWAEYLRAGETAPARRTVDGFDGLQAVKSIADFSKGSIAELFLSGLPLKVFRRGNSFLVLNSQGKVQIIDCRNPHQPTIAGLLPYPGVKHMEMQGDTAYLLLSRPDARNDKLVIVDLGNPHKPRELTRLSLPNWTVSFYLSGRQLVVYTKTEGYKQEHFIHLYDLTTDFQLVSLGRVESSLLRNGFLKYKGYLLVPDDHAGLHVCDFSNPLKPVVVASIDFPAKVRRFTQRGDMVFALGAENQIYVIDLHDPMHPLLSTVVEEASHPAYFVEYGSYSYYFTLNRYLRVFDVGPFDPMAKREMGATGFTGELVSLQTDAGFSLLGKSQDPLTTSVTDVLTLSDKIKVVDTLVWRGLLVVLDDTGLVQFFSQENKSSPVFQESLKLPTAQRWLAAANGRFYVGGESMVHVVAKGGDGHFILSGQFGLEGQESWDGLVIQQTLCLAAGKDGLLCFSLEQPDRPVLSPEWMIPWHLESQIDVRQLTSPGGRRVLLAAGPAGLLSGKLDTHGEFLFDGFIDSPLPSRALAVVGGLCLVSTEKGIFVVDVRDGNSLQNLGEIDFPGVERFAVAGPDLWAGYVPGKGWFPLPSPRLVLPGEFETLQVESSTTQASPYRYRLNLFNDHGVIAVPGILSLSRISGSRVAGAVHGHR